MNTHDIEKAGEIIETILTMYRIPIDQVKEKFGTLRVYIRGFGWYDFHEFCYPNHHYINFTGLLNYINNHSAPVFSIISFFIRPFHKIIYRYAYSRACRKYPYIKDAIICCADYPELLIGL